MAVVDLTVCQQCAAITLAGTYGDPQTVKKLSHKSGTKITAGICRLIRIGCTWKSTSVYVISSITSFILEHDSRIANCSQLEQFSANDEYSILEYKK